MFFVCFSEHSYVYPFVNTRLDRSRGYERCKSVGCEHLTAYPWAVERSCRTVDCEHSNVKPVVVFLALRHGSVWCEQLGPLAVGLYSTTDF